MSRAALCNRVAEILYVDDSADDQLLATEAVSATGRPHELRITSSAIDLWTTLTQRLEQGIPVPSVLVVDLKMPKVDGHHLIQKLGEDPELCSIPVVVLSTSGDPDDLRRATDEGALRYEVKPSRFDDLVQVWSRILDLAER
jgi:CheY-like chemotaxis protein